MTAGKPQTCKVCRHPQVDEINAKIQELKDNLCTCPYCGAKWDSTLSRNAHMGGCDQKNNGTKPITWGRLEDEYDIYRTTLMNHHKHTDGRSPVTTPSPEPQRPVNGILRKIQRLSNERQALWRKSGRRVANLFTSAGLSRSDQTRIQEINRQLKKLWRQHKHCANPFCPCRTNGEYNGPARPNTNSHNRGRLKLK